MVQVRSTKETQEKIWEWKVKISANLHREKLHEINLLKYTMHDTKSRIMSLKNAYCKIMRPAKIRRDSFAQPHNSSITLHYI